MYEFDTPATVNTTAGTVWFARITPPAAKSYENVSIRHPHRGCGSLPGRPAEISIRGGHI